MADLWHFSRLFFLARASESAAQELLMPKRGPPSSKAPFVFEEFAPVPRFGQRNGSGRYSFRCDSSAAGQHAPRSSPSAGPFGPSSSGKYARLSPAGGGSDTLMTRAAELP